MNRRENQFGHNETLREVYYKTEILRKPISGIVSGYHELPYILITPRDENPALTIEVNGKINVSPKFVISPHALQATFGEIFDPETFNQDLQGRVFSFAYADNRQLSIENEYFRMEIFEERPEEHLDRVNDMLMSEENTRTGLIFGPRFRYYPVSIDRYISEIIEREFRV
jgi:hypothetical protein